MNTLTDHSKLRAMQAGRRHFRILDQLSDLNTEAQIADHRQL
jgi:hypothetical protein